MKTAAGLAMSLLAATAALAAETYRWVDEKGVVNYGEKPPANRSAKPVNTQPMGVIETAPRPGEPARAREESRQPVAVAPAPVPPPAGTPVRGMEFDVFIRLQRGMTEGELLLRAGRPDHQSVDNLIDDIAKTYYYFPTTANPYTTVITLRGGRIADLERVKKF